MQEEKKYGHQLEKKPRFELGVGDIIMKSVQSLKDGKRVNEDTDMQRTIERSNPNAEKLVDKRKDLVRNKVCWIVILYPYTYMTGNIGQSSHGCEKTVRQPRY